MKRITINTPLVIRSVFGSYSDTITGTVFAGAAEAASSVVTFYRRTAGNDAWTAIGSVTTSTTSGAFSYAIPSGLAVGEYEWIAVCGDAVSDIVCQWVTNNTTTRQYRNPQRPVGSVPVEAAVGRGATTSWRAQDVRFAMRDGVALTPQRQHFFIDLNKYTSDTSPALLTLLDGTTGITIPASTAWKCKLQVVGRGASLRAASFEIDFLVQRRTGATEIVGTPSVQSFVDSVMGTGENASSVSVAINGDDLEITVQPRVDATVQTLWAGVLEVLEVR